MSRGYLSLHPLIPWMDVGTFPNWRDLFGNSGDLVVEIGFGLGDYLVREAQSTPERNFLGVETGWLPIKRTLRKISFSGVTNVRIVRAPAMVALERLLGERAVAAVNCLFPCPWPKKRHTKNRLFSHEFLLLLNSRMADEGEILVVTDDQAHLDWLKEQVPGSGFESCDRVVQPQFSTKYEKKWVLQGKSDFYALRLLKRRHVPLREKEEFNLITYQVEYFSPEDFHPERCYGNPAVEFKEFLYDPLRQKAMIRCVVGEDGLVQNFWVEIVKEGRLWHIRPAKGCSLLPTFGVQKALDMVYGFVRARGGGEPGIPS